jgi:hypothetical protein
MTIHHLSNQVFRRAQARVPEFIERAKALLSAGFVEELRVVSVLCANTLDHLRVQHLEAVRIYAAPAGGYHGDLHFDNVPDGVPNILGTATACPELTRAAAEDRVVRMLAMLIHRQSRRPFQPPAPEHVIFEFFGSSFRVPIQDVIPEVSTCNPDLEMTIRGRLDAFVTDCLQGEVTAATMEQLPLEHLEELYRLVCSALGARIIRHPPPVPQALSDLH